MILRVNCKDTILTPEHKTSGSCGLDLHIYRPEGSVSIAPGKILTVGTGISVEIPPGYFGGIYNRSSNSSIGITLANAVGVIDSDYRGEIQLKLYNFSHTLVVLNHLQRVAQLIIQPYVGCSIAVVQNLQQTCRGSGGFGSTGK